MNLPPQKQPQFGYQPIENDTGLGRSRSRRTRWLMLVGIVLVLLLGSGLAGFLWYKKELSPVDAGSTTTQRFTVVTGSTPDQIGQSLEEARLIRSQTAFSLYTRLSGTRNKLQAGVYSLSPSESTEDIVTHLVSGKVDTMSITFLPGATLADDREVLLKAGYDVAAVDTALKKHYTSPILADKPADKDLEGFLYGETYQFSPDATPEEIIQRALDEFSDVAAKNNLAARFKARGLTLYQGITLASIIQRETATSSSQKTVAEVFYNRLKIGMVLGSDVTFHYAAKKLGVPAIYTLDSPYNTRIYPGLPPGPIATPGLSALLATAEPDTGDYLYFLSGDDGVMYYAKTAEGHEANITAHCQIACSDVK